MDTEARGNKWPVLVAVIVGVVGIIAVGAWFGWQQLSTDDSIETALPATTTTPQQDPEATTTAPPSTTTSTTTSTTLPPTTTTTPPADLVAGLESTGVFVAAGSTADPAALEHSVANARSHGWDLSVVAVGESPDVGLSSYAGSIATSLNAGTVVTVSPNGLGWASQETQFYDSEFERAWSLIPPDSSEAVAVHSFVWSVLGGPDSVGVLDSQTASWLLLAADGTRNEFIYGDVGDTPMIGDWDCDGIETVGIWRPSGPSIFLRNSNSAGEAAVDYDYTYTGAVPIVGDFDGDGCATVSFHIPDEGGFFIFNAREDLVEEAQEADETVPVDIRYAFGATDDVAFVGDFDGDGTDTVGLFRPSTGMFYLKNTHTDGPADVEFSFGAPGDIPLAGDWTDQDGIDSVAVYRPSTGTFFFRYTNTAGPADETLEFGVVDALPVAGAFGLDRSG